MFGSIYNCRILNVAGENTGNGCVTINLTAINLCRKQPANHLARFILQPMNQYFKIGKLAASFGLKGELALQHSFGKKTSLKGLETIFIEEGKDNFMPYFITGCSIKNHNEVFLKIEGIDTKEAARKLTPKEAWVTEEDFKKFAAKSAPISMLGFCMVNDGTELGEIIEVIEQPHQILCCIMLGGKEALIPIHEESLERIDQKNRKVLVSLPDGLLDIYR